MADDVKSLEMRIAALEDKLSKMHITEEEMKAYEKVASMMGGVPAASAQASPQFCTIARNRGIFCWPGIRRPIITICECQCGPCIEGGGGGFGGFGGGFGGFGG
jgi:hypothetical protein